MRYFLFLIVIFSVIASCSRKDPEITPAVRKAFTFTAPAYPENNAYSPERVRLGKMLFFDPRLSGSGWISCATCHNPVLGWADGLEKGFGHGMAPLGRHTPSIINSAFYATQFWDGRAATLEEQALGPIQAKGEMNQTLENMVRVLSSIEGYKKLFEAAYPGEGITPETTAKAIASFERTIITPESPFDRWLKGDPSAVSESAKRGFALFQGKARCVLCHMGPAFTDNGFHNIGLRSGDIGRYAVVPLPVMKGAFKTPTLRNITETAPYMHNGMYRTLEEVIDHYIRGGDIKDNLSPTLSAVDLSEDEKKDLVEFLKTLGGRAPSVITPDLPK